MEPLPSPLLQMPTFLFGTLQAVQGLTREEGQRCAERYRGDGTLPTPSESRAVAPGEVVILHEVVDFERGRPSWRLYLLGDVATALCERMNWQDTFLLSEKYEALARQTPWGALYYAAGREGPYDAKCYALRFKAVLHFWEVLESARYLYRSPRAPLTLEELMGDACGWAPRVWAPGETGPLRRRLEVAAERMEQATREECTEAILRQVPHTLPWVRNLKHPSVFEKPPLWRERLALLTPGDFARVSAALPGELISCMYLWDEQLDKQ